MPFTLGEMLGPYEIQAPIGAGGMGEVYRARDTRLGRLVAIKTSQARFTERFEREARAVAALNHPHICTLYDVGPDYLVMEYIEGKPLEGPLPLDTVLRYAGQISSALDAAHRLGIVHRDLKPANILVTKSGVKLLDFGLAKFSLAAPESGETQTTQTVTEEGAIVGTLQYMSPEQLEGKEVDARSDIFSFGCVLYELLTGRMAFAGDSKASVIAAILERQPTPITGVPPLVAQAVERALAKDPDDRWQSARDVARVLELAASSQAPATAPKRRWLWPFAAASLALALIAAVAALASLRNRKPPAEDRWSGTQLGGPAFALIPRVSPDGSLIAFETLEQGHGELAVLKPETGNWTLLTHQPGLGEINEVAWSRDGAKIYFDRFTALPAGIYSVPVLGGEPRLVLERAAYPQVLADGSLTVVRINERRDRQLYRFWPESGKLTALPGLPLVPNIAAVRATPDGSNVLFFGNRSNAAGDRMEPGFFAMDPDGGHLRHLAPNVTLPASPSQNALAFAGFPDNLSVLLTARAGALNRFLQIPLDGGDDVKTLFTSTLDSGSVDIAPDGTVYADQIWQQRTLLRFSPSGGGAKRLTAAYSQKVSPIAVLSDGMPLMTIFSSGRSHVVIVQPDGSLSPLLESGETCGPPATPAGAGRIALMTDRPKEVAVVSILEGRVVSRTKLLHGPVASLAASPDGGRFYYASGGYIWSAPASGGGETRLAPGDSVAADPNGRDLVIAAAQHDSVQLSRIPASGGSAQPIPMKPGSPIQLPGLMPEAIGRDGRIVVTVSAASRWFYGLGILDPRSGALTVLPTAPSDEAVSPSWAPDGSIIAEGRDYNVTLWRFRKSAK